MCRPLVSGLLFFALLVFVRPVRAQEIEYCPMYVAWQYNGAYYHWCLKCGEGVPPGEGAYVYDSRPHAVGESCSVIVDPINFKRLEKYARDSGEVLVLAAKDFDHASTPYIKPWDQFNKQPFGRAAANEDRRNNFVPFVAGVKAVDEQRLKFQPNENERAYYFRATTVKIDPSPFGGPHDLDKNEARRGEQKPAPKYVRIGFELEEANVGSDLTPRVVYKKHPQHLAKASRKHHHAFWYEPDGLTYFMFSRRSID